MAKCGRCGEDVLDGVQCTTCKKHYDYPCSGVTEAGYRKLGPERQAAWKCSNCKTGSPKPVTLDLLMHEISEIKLSLRSINETTASITEIKKDIASLRATFEGFSSVVTALEGRLAAVEGKQGTVMQLEARVGKLEEELNEKNQWMRANNVEIKGVPLKDKENLLDIVAKIGSKIQYPIQKHQINFVARVPSKDDRMKPIIVSFLNRYVKEDFVAAARSIRSLYPEDINLRGTNKIYVNDHLTIQNKLLLSKAKSLKKEKEFEFVWVKNSKIFARKNPQSKIIIIKNEKDLLKMV